jgi:hypothetical protein
MDAISLLMAQVYVAHLRLFWLIVMADLKIIYSSVFGNRHMSSPGEDICPYLEELG